MIPKLRQVFHLLTTQGIALAARLLYGFLCVRLLPVSEYAKFTVVFGFLGTLTVLMDVGFSATLLPLIGERIDDRKLIADYVATLRQLAHWLYLAMAPVTMIVYPMLVQRQHWSWRVVAAMVAILLLASWCARVSGIYGAVLIVRRDRGYWYRTQVISNLASLALLAILWLTHSLSAFPLMLTSVAGMVYLAVAYFFRARHLLGQVGQPSREMRHAVVHLTVPSMPNVIFYAFQGQISLILITLFGRTMAVASLGALTRLGQIFMFFGQMNPLLIEPYFAKLQAAKLKRHYLAVIAVEVLLCVALVAAAGYVPQVFLWVLGSKYSGLHTEVLLMIAGNSLNYLAGLQWSINSSRKFVYWWNGMATIVATLAIEVIFFWKVDLSSVRNTLWMNLVTALALLLINMLTGVYGFVFGPRRSGEMLVAAQGGSNA